VEKAAAGGFFEWAEYLGNLYGTPVADPPPGRDVLLEIDLQGARQVRAMRPDALLILLKPPSLAVQEERLRARGDDEAHIARRLREGVDEERMGLEIADEIVVNGQLAQATADVAGIVERYRAAARGGGQAARPTVGPGIDASHPTPDEAPEGS
jgi:guanylate kinase